MDTFIMIAQLLLALSVLVIVHEAGHYLAARAFGIKVDKFYLFFDAFNFRLFKFKRGDTEYGLGWLPLGGYVKISGMIDESMDKEFKDRAPEPHEFRSKPAWQRLIVMLGGIFMNIILATLIFVGHTAFYGETYINLQKAPHGIAAYKLGEDVGFKDGDRIVAVNGEPARRFPQDVLNDKLLLDRSIIYTVNRNGDPVDIHLNDTFAKTLLSREKDRFIDLRYKFKVKELQDSTRAYKAGLREGDSILTLNGNPIKYYDDFKDGVSGSTSNIITLGLKDSNGVAKTINVPLTKDKTVGFMAGLETMDADTQHFGATTAFLKGTSEAKSSFLSTPRGLGRLLRKEVPANKSVSGLIGIANAYGGTWNWNHFWNLTARLSMVLAFMNLLPIPALDGGHVLFLLVEMVRRRPLSYKFLEVAQTVGMVLVFLLMGYAFYNDLARFAF